jgi:uncharacterized protein YecE (DUF72 family)
MTIFVGTSGWQYGDWCDAFYPRGVSQREWLAYYAARFQIVEVNNSFYQLPKLETARRWAETTPPDFLFAMKMTRYLTHIKRLKEPEEPIERFFEMADEMSPKLGPVLLQLPPNMRQDLSRLAETLDAIPKGVRVAVEFRHESWHTPECRALLADRGAANCLADRRDKLVTPDWATADWAYIRFHEGVGAAAPCYSPDALRNWADRIATTWDRHADVYAFFNNDARGCAVLDAIVLAALLRQRGLEVSRVPASNEIHIAFPAA